MEDKTKYNLHHKSSMNDTSRDPSLSSFVIHRVMQYIRVRRQVNPMERIWSPPHSLTFPSLCLSDYFFFVIFLNFSPYPISGYLLRLFSETRHITWRPAEILPDPSL